MSNKTKKVKSTRKTKARKMEFVLVGPVERVKKLFAEAQNAFAALTGTLEPFKKDLAQVLELLEIERGKLAKNSKPKTIGHGLDSLALLLDESKRPEISESRDAIEARVQYLEQVQSAGNQFVELITGVVAVLSGESESARPRLANGSTAAQDLYAELVAMTYGEAGPGQADVFRDIRDLVQAALEERFDRAELLSKILGREVNPRDSGDLYKADREAVLLANKSGMKVPPNADRLTFGKLVYLSKSRERDEEKVQGSKVPTDLASNTEGQVESLVEQLEETTQRGVARAAKRGKDD